MSDFNIVMLHNAFAQISFTSLEWLKIGFQRKGAINKCDLLWLSIVIIIKQYRIHQFASIPNVIKLSICHK